MSTDLNCFAERNKTFPLLEKVTGWLKSAGLEYELTFDKRSGLIALRPFVEATGECVRVLLDVSNRGYSVTIHGLVCRPVPSVLSECVCKQLEGLSDCRGFFVGPYYAELWSAQKQLAEESLRQELLLAELEGVRSVVRECERLLAPLRRV